MFNFRVRNGNGLFHIAWTTERQIYIKLVAGGGLEPPTFGLWAQRAAAAPPRNKNEYLQVDFLNGLNPRTISIAQLKVLPLLHMQPINPVVSRGPYSHKEMGNLILRRASHLDAFSAYP